MFGHRSRCSSLSTQLTGMARCGRSGESPGGAELKLRAADSKSDLQISPSKLNIRHQAHPLLPTYTACYRLINSQARPLLIRHHEPRIRTPETTSRTTQICLSMATMAAESSPSSAGSDSTSTERLPMPSRNPLPLSASQEAQVREIFYERVRGYCGPEIKGRCRIQSWAITYPAEPLSK